ncbi:MAG: hypothetical protein ACI9NC_006073, partial [Verrucomicrobiales bacterium]
MVEISSRNLLVQCGGRVGYVRAVVECRQVRAELLNVVQAAWLAVVVAADE